MEMMPVDPTLGLPGPGTHVLNHLQCGSLQIHSLLRNVFFSILPRNRTKEKYGTGEMMERQRQGDRDMFALRN